MDLSQNTWIKKIKKYLINTKHRFLIEAIKWFLIDLYRIRKYGKSYEFGEFTMLVGRRGAGKTLTLSRMLYEYRNKFDDNIYIATNFGWSGEDFQINHWKQLMEDYDKPIIFGFDEIQNEFDSREWKNFPSNLFHDFTQARKKGKMIISTAQYYEMTDKKVRFYTDNIIEITRVLGYNRILKLKTYERTEYERKTLADKSLFFGNIPYIKKELFIASDLYRNLYDTHKMIERSREKQYIPMKEKEFAPIEPSRYNLKLK